jgi:CheY-like chemotaxis protein
LDYAISVAQARRQQADAEKLRIISQLAISVNHEINNPLAGLMGTAELMVRDNQALDEKGRRDMQTIITQCKRIQEITTRLKHLNHLRTVPYGQHDRMIDLVGEIQAPVWQNATPPQQFLETPRILVVDDNPLIVDLIARIFDNRYEIDAAACASDALSKLEQAPADLVLIDLILPEMNGLELFRAIRRLRQDQKALLTTAYHGDARVEQAIHEGALGCVYKPFQLEELEKALDEALKK